MQESGLHIENDLGNNGSAKVKATDDIMSLDQPDLIIIAVKMWDLEDIARDLKKIAGPNTAVLSLQNGVIKDYVLRRVFGEDSVIGGVGYVATSIGSPGVIKQVGALQRHQTRRIRRPKACAHRGTGARIRRLRRRGDAV